MDIRIQEQVRGVRLLAKETAALRRRIIDICVEAAKLEGFEEVFLPSLELFSIYEKKTGPEIESQMYVFPDRKGRKLCLRPEGTATCQAMAREIWKNHKDVKIFYEARCWRYERPQAGRYREFTQFGVEWLWPRDEEKARRNLAMMAEATVLTVAELLEKKIDMEIQMTVKRGLSYYVKEGFEISIPSLGAQKQVVGGGAYAEGVGFAIGVDRLMEACKS